ncbi:hypothetical protein MAR_033107 [Mya arenaria]|uniref:Uncharacterized protein n=1 Tax=Mya arenaria TaxID=6604 RepID=A0ABY7G817_MYAAR|nr:hypothetical protein MAR_033107 [Mya arenaria]
MLTVVNAPSFVVALKEVRLSPEAVQVVQEDRARPLTKLAYSSIFRMATVVFTPALERTILDKGLGPLTFKIVHPYRPSASSDTLTVLDMGDQKDYLRVSKLSTNDMGVPVIPRIITNGTPHTGIPDFNAPRTETQSTNYSSIRLRPSIIADCPPDTVIQDFNATLVGLVTSCQTDLNVTPTCETLDSNVFIMTAVVYAPRLMI